jgi:hypothetical protein
MTWGFQREPGRDRERWREPKTVVATPATPPAWSCQQPQALAIVRALDAAHGPRQRNRLSPRTVATALQRLQASGHIAWCAGTTQGDGNAALVLAVRLGDAIVLRIGNAAGHQITPGRVWAALKPWRPSDATFPRRLRAWLADAGLPQIRCPLADLPALIAALATAPETGSSVNNAAWDAQVDGVCDEH